jgi:hypothetical protein
MSVLVEHSRVFKGQISRTCFEKYRFQKRRVLHYLSASCRLHAEGLAVTDLEAAAGLLALTEKIFVAVHALGDARAEAATTELGYHLVWSKHILVCTSGARFTCNLFKR